MGLMVVVGTLVAMGFLSNGDIAIHATCHLHACDAHHHSAETSLVRD
jgi:hypothetical protein